MAARRHTPILRLDRPTERERARLARDGFVTIAGVLDGCDFTPVRRAVESANRHARRLPSWAVQNLGNSSGELPQINGLTRLYPSLRGSEIVTRLQEVAAGFLGEPATLRFDFSITKPPGNPTEVPWHQDQAYHPAEDQAERVHMWIPLQDTNATMGCMEYLVGSHLRGRMAHQRASAGHRYALSIAAQAEGDSARCETKRGDVIAHTSLTWHRTGPNVSNTNRAMWALEFERASGARSNRPTTDRLARTLDVVRYRASTLRR